VSPIGSGVVCWSLFDILRCAMFLNGIRPGQADRDSYARNKPPTVSWNGLLRKGRLSLTQERKSDIFKRFAQKRW
jgi:hypothetical protein